AVRLRHTLAEPHHVIQPFDQEMWAKRYDGLTARAALAVFVAVREWNLALVHAASPSEFTKAATHPERGEMTFRVLVETMAGHDRNHLKQVEGIAAARLG
ncbi:MAG: DinB family protein, partial [Bryobacteraceae bacterium]